MLDLFSDVGGLRIALLSGMSVLMNVWNHNYLTSYIASKLFKSSEKIDGDDEIRTPTIGVFLKILCV